VVRFKPRVPTRNVKQQHSLIDRDVSFSKLKLSPFGILRFQDCQLWPMLWQKDCPASSPEDCALAPPTMFLLITACDFYAEMPR
jgi:hypothetical protein